MLGESADDRINCGEFLLVGQQAGFNKQIGKLLNRFAPQRWLIQQHQAALHEIIELRDPFVADDSANR